MSTSRLEVSDTSWSIDSHWLLFENQVGIIQHTNYVLLPSLLQNLTGQILFVKWDPCFMHVTLRSKLRYSQKEIRLFYRAVRFSICRWPFDWSKYFLSAGHQSSSFSSRKNFRAVVEYSLQVQQGADGQVEAAVVGVATEWSIPSSGNCPSDVGWIFRSTWRRCRCPCRHRRQDQLCTKIWNNKLSCLLCCDFKVNYEAWKYEFKTDFQTNRNV